MLNDATQLPRNFGSLAKYDWLKKDSCKSTMWKRYVNSNIIAQFQFAEHKVHFDYLLTL